MKREVLLQLLSLVVVLHVAGPAPSMASDAPDMSAHRVPQAALAFPPVIRRVSVASDGTQSDAPSYAPAISGDGRYVAFDSDATNLVPGDTNGQSDVFIYDRATGQITKVSVAYDGSQADGGSYFASISSDGRYVAFESSATNLVVGDTNGSSDVFVYDRDTGQITRVSVASDGSQATGASYLPTISGDGRYVAFESNTTNLIPGDTNGWSDVFVHDRSTGQTTRVNVDSVGTEADSPGYLPSISGDGRYVAFESDATNLVPGDTNGDWDIFVHDRITGQTTRVSTAYDGGEANGDSNAPTISGDGRYVTFESAATNLVPGDTNGSTDIFVHDRSTGETTRVTAAPDGTPANGDSHTPDISSDGRYVAFWSSASNLVPGDTNGVYDVFVHDRNSGHITRVSVTSDGTETDGETRYPRLSGDGRYVAFESDGSNLVPGDTNNSTDILVRDALLACSDLQDPQGVGLEDVQAMAGLWRQERASLDLDGDQIITIADVMYVAAASGPCP